MKTDLKAIAERLKINRIILKDQVYVKDVTDLLAHISDLEAVVRAAREFDKFSRKIEESKQLLGHSEYIISKNLRGDLRQAIAKLDGDPS